MDNASLSSDDWDSFTTTSSKNDDSNLFLAHIRELALKIVYIIMGTVGVLDNLFVVITFALFIKIADKVLAILQLSNNTILAVPYSYQSTITRYKINYIKLYRTMCLLNNDTHAGMSVVAFRMEAYASNRPSNKLPSGYVSLHLVRIFSGFKHLCE